MLQDTLYSFDNRGLAYLSLEFMKGEFGKAVPFSAKTGLSVITALYDTYSLYDFRIAALVPVVDKVH